MAAARHEMTTLEKKEKSNREDADEAAVCGGTFTSVANYRMTAARQLTPLPARRRKTRLQSQLQYLHIGDKVGMENQETSDMKGKHVYDLDVYTRLAPLDSWNVTSGTVLSSLHVD